MGASAAARKKTETLHLGSRAWPPTTTAYKRLAYSSPFAESSIWQKSHTCTGPISALVMIGVPSNRLGWTSRARLTQSRTCADVFAFEASISF